MPSLWSRISGVGGLSRGLGVRSSADVGRSDTARDSPATIKERDESKELSHGTGPFFSAFFQRGGSRERMKQSRLIMVRSRDSGRGGTSSRARMGHDVCDVPGAAIARGRFRRGASHESGTVPLGDPRTHRNPSRHRPARIPQLRRHDVAEDAGHPAPRYRADIRAGRRSRARVRRGRRQYRYRSEEEGRVGGA